MSIDGASSYITHWYSVHRLRQAVSNGILQKSPERYSAAEPLTMRDVRGKVKATYEHPFLGKHVDMMI